MPEYLLKIVEGQDWKVHPLIKAGEYDLAIYGHLDNHFKGFCSYVRFKALASLDKRFTEYTDVRVDGEEFRMIDILMSKEELIKLLEQHYKVFLNKID